MPNQQLTPGDILQRRLDVLGISAPVSLSSAHFGQITAICQLGSIYYPTGANRIWVAYLIVIPSGTIPNQANFLFGCNATVDDWSTASSYNLGLFPFAAGAPLVLPPYLNVAEPLWNPPVYQKGAVFAIKNDSAAATSVSATFTAIGWAE